MLASRNTRIALFALCLASFASYASDKQKPEARGKEDNLQSFYIAYDAVSDASPFWFDYVLDVSLETDAAHLTLLRVAPLDENCSNRVTVKAKETTLPINQVRELTRGMCSLTANGVERALRESKPDRLNSVFESARQGVVTNCGGHQEFLRIPLPEEIDGSKLHRLHPQYDALRSLYWKLLEAAFKGNPLASNYGEYDADSQRAAEPFIEKIRSGAFDRGFWKRNYAGGGTLSSELSRYKGVATSVGPSGQLENKDTFPLAHYVPPVYPRIALAARVQGRVKLTFKVNPENGTVQDVVATDGHPMLRQAAIDAARLWRFDLPLGDKPPEQATINFDLSHLCDSSATQAE